MELRYQDATKARLRFWRDNDPLLYSAASTELRAIKGNPRGHGIDGTPHVSRVTTFNVPGRDDDYVITWDAQATAVFIGDVCPVEELRQRARLR